MYNKGPFASWVPKPLMLLLIIFFLSVSVSINGVYSSDVIGAMANYNEYYTMANNAGIIGMSLGVLLALRLKMHFRSKELILFSSLSTALLSIIIVTSNSVEVLVTGTFLINFFKMPMLFEMVLPMMFILSPTGDRGRFYAIFYPIMLGGSFYTAYLFANSVNDTSWQTPYYTMAILMLVVALCSVVFQHNQRFSFKMPLHQVDWLSMVLYISSLMLINYGLVFMRQQAWFYSPYIVFSLIGGVLLFGLLIYRQKFIKRKFINFGVFLERENVKHGLVLLIFTGLFMVGAGFTTQYTTAVLGYNNLINAKLNLWQIVGFVIAGVLAFFYFKKQWNMKYYIATGFGMFFIYLLFFYFMIQPQMNIEYLYIPTIFRGLGMGMLFISIWFYASLHLEMADMLGVVAVLIVVRTFIATSVGSAFLGWAMYQGQQQSLNDITMYLDRGQYGMNVYQSSQLGAMMASLKSLWGMLLWCFFPIVFFVLTHHYGKFDYRRMVFFRKRLKGSSTKGYRF